MKILTKNTFPSVEEEPAISPEEALFKSLICRYKTNLRLWRTFHDPAMKKMLEDLKKEIKEAKKNAHR